MKEKTNGQLLFVYFSTIVLQNVIYNPHRCVKILEREADAGCKFTAESLLTTVLKLLYQKTLARVNFSRCLLILIATNSRCVPR